MALVLGVEGGGSHTHAVVADTEDGVLGAAGNTDPSNWEDVGFEAASGAIRACLREVLGDAGCAPADISASVFGLAGVDFPIDADLLSGVPDASGLTGHNTIVNDSFVALRAGTEEPFGVVVVAGTGSVVAGRNPAGEVFRTLGLGPTYGDWGSASEISAAGVSAVADAYLGRGPETMLTTSMCEQAGVASVVEFLEATGRGRIDDSRFAPVVDRAARQGDGAAQRILVTAGERLGANAAHVIRVLGMRDLALEVVMAGGIFRSGSPELLSALEETVRATAPAAGLVPLDAPPVVGSVLMAAESAGLPVPPAFRSTLVSEVTAALGIGVEELRPG